MNLKFDTLECVNITLAQGGDEVVANALSATLSAITIWNLYDDTEVETMLNEAMERTLHEFRKDSDRQVAAIDKQILMMEKRLEADQAQARLDRAEARKEAIATRRWLVGTLITGLLALGTYLSTLLHVIHTLIHR